MVPRGHGPSKAVPSLLFSGSDRAPGPGVELSKYFSCSNAKSKTETLIDLTASQVLSPTCVTSVSNKYLLPRH